MAAGRAGGWCWALGLLLLALGAQAQGWERALTLAGAPPGSNEYSYIQCMTTDANGDIIVAGGFNGTLAFGSTRLVSTGPFLNSDIFLAKWRPSTGTWLWALREGGAGHEYPDGLAVSGGIIYLTGAFANADPVVLAGSTLPNVGSTGTSIFLAKYLDLGTSAAGQWAVSGGGSGINYAHGVAVSGTSLYLTGGFVSGTGFQLAGTTLPGAGDLDVYLAKYTDLGTSAAANWAVSAGGSSLDEAYGIDATGPVVYLAGAFGSRAGSTFGGIPLTGAGGTDAFLAKFTDTGSGPLGVWAVSGGGTSNDYTRALARVGPRLYVTGWVVTGTAASVAGTPLPGVGSVNTDMFLACYTDQGSTVAGNWAVSGGGTGNDSGWAVTAQSGSVYVAGMITSGGGATVAGTVLTGAGRQDHFLARYNDTGPAATAGWANTGGGASDDICRTVAVSGRRVCIGGNVNPPSSFGTFNVGYLTAVQPQSALVQAYDNAAPQPQTTVAARQPALALWPNPAGDGATTLAGASPGAAVQVLDALGRVVRTARADAGGTARLTGLAPGFYLVRAGGGTARLAVE